MTTTRSSYTTDIGPFRSVEVRELESTVSYQATIEIPGGVRLSAKVTPSSGSVEVEESTPTAVRELYQHSRGGWRNEVMGPMSAHACRDTARQALVGASERYADPERVAP